MLLVACFPVTHPPPLVVLVVVRCTRSDVNKVTHVFRSHNTSVKRLNPLAPVSVRLPVPSHARRAIPAPLRRLRPDPPSALLGAPLTYVQGPARNQGIHRTAMEDRLTEPAQRRTDPALPSLSRPPRCFFFFFFFFFFSRSLLFSPSSLPAALTYPPAIFYLTSRQPPPPPPPPPPPTPCQHSRARTADRRADEHEHEHEHGAPPSHPIRQIDSSAATLSLAHSLFCGCRAKVMLSRCWQRSRTRLSI
ncbi:hypothetical protein IWZ03DRAFT_117093 [Phyllosticta citriasiana]|uniref:Uncharacterized protein n=1 Tax=Phyllosticta citriasiana TaxID=595635 RepID=A0ABR1KW42_9PEZI